MRYSKVEGTLRWSMGTILLRKGMSVDDDHPLVKERPDLFDQKDPGADVPTRGPQVGNVERATAAPGETRVTPGTGPQSGNRVPKPRGSAS